MGKEKIQHEIQPFSGTFCTEKSTPKKSGAGLILGLSLGGGILLLALRIALCGVILMGSTLPLAQPEIPVLPSWEESTPPADDGRQKETEV